MTKPYDALDGVWYRPSMKTHRIQCCDCGLVHREEYRIVSVGKGKEGIEVRAWRDPKKTASVRRAFKFSKE